MTLTAPSVERAAPGIPAQPARALRRPRWRVHPAWIVIAGACAVIWREAIHSGLETDVYWQWAAGAWMLEHHAVIRSDVFSYTIHGRSWLDDEWGFQVLLAELVRVVGPVTFWLVSAGACTGALLAGVARWRRTGATWLWTALLAIVAGGCLVVGDAPRPQCLSYLFFSLELLVLVRARSNPRWLAALPPLVFVWANVHGSFLIGIALLGLEILLSVVSIDRARVRSRAPLAPRTALATFAVSLGATFLNPHGVRLLFYAFHVTTDSQLSALIEEWQSPNFHSLALLVLIVAPMLFMIGALALTSWSVDVFDLVVWVGLLLATLHAQRFLPYLGLAFGACAAQLSATWREAMQGTRVTVPVTAAFCLALLAGPHVAAGAPATSGSAGVPVAATNWLEGRPGRVFSTYAWNDYLIHRAVPVFVDGRTDLYFGTGVLQQWVNVDDLTLNPDTVFKRWEVAYVLWPKSDALTTYLEHDQAWRQVFSSGDQVVFVHRGSW